MLCNSPIKRVGTSMFEMLTARLDSWLWLSLGKPSSVSVYKGMCLSRKLFKNKLKWCQNHHEQIKLDLMASHRVTNTYRTLWKAIMGLGLFVTVTDASETEGIANGFVENFRVKSPFELVLQGLDDGACSCPDFIVLPQNKFTYLTGKS